MITARADKFPATARVGVLLSTLLLTVAAEAQLPRDRTRIVGSSTVFPYSQAVAEHYVGLTRAKAPVVEATGTGGGLKIFCGGVGAGFPDITGASRPMTASEYRDCASNGAADLTEALIGDDALSLTQSVDGPPLELTRRDLFLALAAEVPVNGEVVANPYRSWRDIRPTLPDMPIAVFGPPPTSGTRDALIGLVMQPACEGFAEIRALDDGRRAGVCARPRRDGGFIEASENDNVIVRRIVSDPGTVGIFGFPFLHENHDMLRGIPIDGVEPSARTLRDGTYPLTRPLFLYIKNAHRAVIPGMEALLGEYLSEEAIGPEGYLAERGLVPLDAAERRTVRTRVAGHARIARFE